MSDPTPTRLRVRLLTDDGELRRGLRGVLGDEAIDVIAHATAPVHEILLVDAGPAGPGRGELKRVKAEHRSAPVVVIASEFDADARELGDAMSAVAYVKKERGLHEIAPLIVALASLSG